MAKFVHTTNTQTPSAMRNLPLMNEYQQLLYSALALVEEADLVAILRVAGQHPDRNRCIDLVNAELDKGLPLWDTFAEGSSLCDHFNIEIPEFRVRIDMENRSIDLDFGTHGQTSDLLSWKAYMGPTGVVEKLDDPYRYWPEDVPVEFTLGSRAWDPLHGICLQ